MIASIAEADKITGGLGKPSKMPGYAYGIPAKECRVGSKLVKIKGSVCSGCYALKGRYAFKNVQDAEYRRYYSLTHPQWVEAMTYLLTKRRADYFRWHDSGDLQDMAHLNQIVDVAVRCPGTKFWLPTRENALVSRWLRYNPTGFPPNLVVRVSGTLIDGPAPKNFANTSTVTTRGDQTCPAYNQGGKCGPCRACWNPGVGNISYPKH